MVPSLAGRNAIVTGSARGLGAQFAIDLAKAGANVLINYTSDSSKPKAEGILEEIRKVNPTSISGAVQADVGSENIGQDIVKAAVNLFSNGDSSSLRIHILIHNAAVTHSATLEQETLQGFNHDFNVNVRGTFLITQAVRPYIPNHDNARIIVISSVSARRNGPGRSVYSATKAALESFVRSWSNEFAAANGITVNAVNPGPVKTDLWNESPQEWRDSLPPFPVAETSDISDVVLFLASRESRWITGSVVSANRGILLI